MEAASEHAVISSLQAQGHISIRAEEVNASPGPAFPSVFNIRDRRPGRNDLHAFSIDLAALLQAKVALAKALGILVSITDKAPLKKVLEQIQVSVGGGAPLSAALAAHGRLFSPFYCNVVRAGEESDCLGAALTRLAELTQRSRDLRDTILSRLLYPIILVIAGIVSIAVILGLVMPKISQMFAQSGQSLPWFTQAVVAAGGVVQDYWWAILAAVFGIFIFMRWQYAHPARRRRWDGWLLRMPLIGALITRLEAARFTRTLSALLSDGIVLPDAIVIAKEVVVNQIIVEGMSRVAERVRQGEGLARPLAEARVFPPLSGHLIQVGEESGNLQAMLMELAHIYENELQTALRRLMAVLEPALVLGLAAFVAVIMFSIVVAILGIN